MEYLDNNISRVKLYSGDQVYEVKKFSIINRVGDFIKDKMTTYTNKRQAESLMRLINSYSTKMGLDPDDLIKATQGYGPLIKLSRSNNNVKKLIYDTKLLMDSYPSEISNKVINNNKDILTGLTTRRIENAVALTAILGLVGFAYKYLDNIKELSKYIVNETKDPASAAYDSYQLRNKMNDIRSKMYLARKNSPNGVSVGDRLANNILSRDLKSKSGSINEVGDSIGASRLLDKFMTTDKNGKYLARSTQSLASSALKGLHTFKNSPKLQLATGIGSMVATSMIANRANKKKEELKDRLNRAGMNHDIK